ncbi:hypothetical protein [Mycolicibacterium goodii]|uniref:Secreted protein n=1 Tax=Mycolicibacterium goodii TaxID=134601 RepID=A0ABS6HQF5_MYCGD|nr:hypothetical protein [Mycolicibacterium goodii]MBU8824926.1 hypothetical protein [Mycolicibacterium goodii]MBU8840714.1 hypothetical protein [Mycolicibacterium goodii]
MAVVLAIALTAVVTVLIIRPDSGTSTAQGNPDTTNPEFASASDNGPITIITDDPTCNAWGRIAREYSDATQAEGWGDRDYTTPVSSWTPEQRQMYEAVGKAMTRAAEQTIALSKQTPHRVMRELYQQFIAYAQKFTSKLPSYSDSDDNIAVATDAFMIAAANICSAIDYGTAQAIGPQVTAAAPGPTATSKPLDATNPSILMPKVNTICSEWASLVTKYSDATAEWRALDRRIPAKEWTREYRSVNQSVADIMTANAHEMEQLGRQASDSTVEDIAILAAQYQRGFVKAIPTYAPADNLLAESATQLMRTVNWACKAVEP